MRLYRREIRLGNTGSNVSLSGCQIPVRLNAGNFSFANAKADGSDIAFFRKGGIVPLPFWVESWDSTLQLAKVWVKADATAIAAAVSTIEIHYGDPAATSLSSFPSAMSLDSTGAHHYGFDSQTLANGGIGGGNAAVEGTTSFVAVRGGFALNLSAGCLVSPAFAAGFTPTGSIAFDFAPNVELGPGTAGGKRLMHKVNIAGTDDLDAYFDNATGNLVVSCYKAGVVRSLRSEATVWQAGRTYHFCFVWNTKKIILYIDGIRQDHTHWNTGGLMPNAGSGTQLRFGCYNSGSGNQLFSNVRIDNVAIYALQLYAPRVEALAQHRQPYAKDQLSKLTRNAYPKLIPAAAEFEIQESSLLYDTADGKWKIWYTAGDGDNPTGLFIGYRESFDLVTWTAGLKVLGNGGSGEPGSCFRSFVVRHTTGFHCYFQIAVSFMGGTIYRVESADGKAWTNKQVCTSPTTDGSWSGGYHSPAVVRDGATYHMLLDGDSAAFSPGDNAPRYELGHLKSTDGIVFSQAGIVNPQRGMQFGADMKGMYGGPYLAKISGSFFCWYQTTDKLNTAPFYFLMQGILPTEIRYSRTNDFLSYEKAEPRPVVALEDADEIDQTADPSVFSTGALTVMTYSAVDNGFYDNPAYANFTSELKFLSFAGSLEQLVNDFSVMVMQEKTAPDAKIALRGDKLIFQNNKPVTLTA